MAYYMAHGENGVIVVNSWKQVLKTRKNLIGNNNKRYETYREAERAALEHLRDIAPDYLLLNKMVTVNQLNEEFLKKEDKR